MNRSKIKKMSQIFSIAKRAKAAGKKIVTTNGTFDILHVGHIHVFEKAKSLGDILIVGINSNSSVRTYKDKSRPIIPENERALIVASLAAVDYVFIFSTPKAIPWLQKIKPHVHVKGGDRTPKEIPETEIIKKNGGKLILVPYVKGHSTTTIIEKIEKTK